MTDKELKVVEAMRRFGGSFVQSLAECFSRADHYNFTKLRLTFSEYWNQYEAMAESKNK